MSEPYDQRLHDRLRAHLDRVAGHPAPPGFEKRLMNIAVDGRPPVRRNRLGGLALGTATVAAFAAVAGLALWAHQTGGPGRAGGAAGPGASPARVDGVGTTDAGMTMHVSVDFRDLVTGVLVHPGDQVHRGQPLLSLDPVAFPPQAAALNAKLELLGAQIQSAVQRMQSEQNRNMATVSPEVEQINSLQAEKAIVQQQLDIAQGRASEILTPIDGVIGSVTIQPGAYASPGQVLLTVLDLTNVRVTASLPIGRLASVKFGTPVEVTFTNLPGVVLRGQVVNIVPGTMAGTTGDGRSFQAIIEAANTSDKRVIPGLKAWVRLTAGGG
jgi:multidrug resistance efflux pump